MDTDFCKNLSHKFYSMFCDFLDYQCMFICEHICNCFKERDLPPADETPPPPGMNSAADAFSVYAAPVAVGDAEGDDGIGEEEWCPAPSVSESDWYGDWEAFGEEEKAVSIKNR